MTDLSELAGIKPSSIYNHFDSKDDLIKQCVLKEIDTYHAYLGSKLRELDAYPSLSKLKLIYYSITTYFYDYQKLRFWKHISMITNSVLLKECRSRIIEHEKVLTLKLLETFELGIKNHELNVVSINGSMFMFISMIHGLLDGMLLYWDSGYDLDRLIDETWEAYNYSIEY